MKIENSAIIQIFQNELLGTPRNCKGKLPPFDPIKIQENRNKTEPNDPEKAGGRRGLNALTHREENGKKEGEKNEKNGGETG